MSTQDPSKFQGNRQSTPTDSIAPGDPLWTSGDQHENVSLGWGYDYHDPISRLKGDADRGNANIRFGKFTFDESRTVLTTEHGSVLRIPVYRLEGATGTFTNIIRQAAGNHVSGVPQTGVLGTINDVVQYRYGACKSDLDLYTLNRDYVDQADKEHRESFGFNAVGGCEWDPVQKHLRLTWTPGEFEKILHVIVPYRTEVKQMQPAVLRQKQTYYIQEYNAVRANTYSGNYIEQNGHTYVYSYELNANDQTSRITNHWHWYRCYTLPMPRSWLQNIVGNYTYIDNWDLNYKYRVTNNTERNIFEPNRPDDTTNPDAETEGFITRYDHYNKMNLVKGKTRFSRWAMRRGSTPRWADQSSNGNYRRPITDGVDQTWAAYDGTSNSNMADDWIPPTDHANCDEFPTLQTAGYTKGIRWAFFSWWGGYRQRQSYAYRKREEHTYPDASTRWFIDVPSNAQPAELHYNNDTMDPQACPQRWTGNPDYNGRPQTNPNRDPGNWYSANWSRNWIANDARVTHRRYPTFPNAFMIGILALGDSVVYARINNDAAVGETSNDHWDVQKRRLWPRPSSENAGGMTIKWIPLPRSTANDVKWTRDKAPADLTLKYINEYNHANPGNEYDEFYSTGTWSKDDTHPESPWHAVVGSNNHNWGTIKYDDQSWYESTRMDMDDGDPIASGNANLTQKLGRATDTGTLANGDWIYSSTPKDKIFGYGDPATGRGDLAQPMFNHYGCLSSEFAPFGQVLGPVYVMGEEDPSHLKEVYDYPSHGSAFDPTATELKGGEANQKWEEEIWFSSEFYRWTPLKHQYTLTNNWSNEQFPNLGGWHGVGSDLGDWTDRWITQTTNTLISAGKLDASDHPLSVTDPDGSSNQYFDGYCWDDTKYFDTSMGSGVNKTGGFGSPGHGEGGTSRYLYDHHHMVHPLSSYELNETNLRGHYSTCIDHLDRLITIELIKENINDEYDLGYTKTHVSITKNGVLVDPDYWARYDYRVLADHFINPGNTYQDNDGWETKPTAASLNARLFSYGVPGNGLCDPSDPVLFLGLSAGNMPGGTMQSSIRVSPPKPGKLRVTPQNVDAKNAFRSGMVSDTLVSDNNYITQPTALNTCAAENTNTADQKNYEFSFKNVGEAELEVSFSTVYKSNYGPYTETESSADGGTCPPGCYIEDEARGDKLNDWTDAGSVISHAYLVDGTDYTDPSGRTYRRGTDGFNNTVSLSAGEEAIIKYDVTCQTGNKQGYWFTHNYTTDLLDGTINNGSIVFNIGATI